MSTTTKVLISLAVGFALLVAVPVFYAFGWYNDVISAEEGVRAQWKANQNEYDSYWKKIKEAGQVPDKYKDDFKELLVSETSAKFGPEGSKAMFQWFKDRDINFSDKMYVKMQNLIESGRNDFKRAQNELISKQQRLTTEIRQAPGSIMAMIFNMPAPVSGWYAPKEDIDGDGKLTVLDYPIVTSTKTEKVFDSGKEEEELDVFSRKDN